MGLIADAARNLIRPHVPPMASAGGIWRSASSGGPQNYEQFARRGYAGNEIVFSAIELLATSAAEPHIIGRRWRRASPQRRITNAEAAAIRDEIRHETLRLRSKGHSLAEVNDLLVHNGFIVHLPGHPLVRLVNAPNPFMSRGQCWSTIVMDRYLGGNAYLLKARNKALGNVQELWRLRPDRVRIMPDEETFCKYEYRVPRAPPVTFEYRDVMHFKTRNPLDDYYGMPPLMAISGRLDIDAYMRTFLKTFYEQGGTGPGSILSVKQKVSQEAKDNIRERFRKQFGGSSGFHEMLILDNAESTYQQMGLNRGLRDALPKELDAVSEARIAMVFGIPGSILGLLIGYESSSYANKRQDWQVLWDVTMTPLLSDLDDVLNLSLVPEFGGIDEVLFDLSDIKALQEDVDAIQDRARKNLQVGGWSLQEFRDATGKDPEDLSGTFLIPMNVAATQASALSSGNGHKDMADALRALLVPPAIEKAAVVAEVYCPNCGRWIGRNMNVGATAYCPKCKAVEVTA